jgi:hypothetical protein
MYWQTLVQVYNFIRVGIDMSKVIIVIEYETAPDQNYIKLAKETGIRVIFYKKDYTSAYLPIVRPKLFEKFFKDFPEFEKEYILYHDSDIIYRDIPNYTLMQDGAYYVAPCSSYLGYDYLKQKGRTIIDDMCKVTGVTYNNILSNRNNSGGAQYYGIGTNAAYWNEVSADCDNIYNTISQVKQEYMNELFEYHSVYFPEDASLSKSLEQFYQDRKIQIWTAGMWAELFCLWKHKFKVIETPLLDFSWGTSDFKTYLERPFMHNAGVMSDNKELFDKGAYKLKMPFNDDFSFINPSTASYMYVKEMKEAGKYFKHLIQ